MTYQCWQCAGRSWVSDGQIEDGMMTGRKACPACGGTGYLSPESVLDHLRKVVTAPSSKKVGA